MPFPRTFPDGGLAPKLGEIERKILYILNHLSSSNMLIRITQRTMCSNFSFLFSIFFSFYFFFFFFNNITLALFRNLHPTVHRSDCVVKCNNICVRYANINIPNNRCTPILQVRDMVKFRRSGDWQVTSAFRRNNWLSRRTFINYSRSINAALKCFVIFENSTQAPRCFALVLPRI